MPRRSASVTSPPGTNPVIATNSASVWRAGPVPRSDLTGNLTLSAPEIAGALPCSTRISGIARCGAGGGGICWSWLPPRGGSTTCARAPWLIATLNTNRTANGGAFLIIPDLLEISLRCADNRFYYVRYQTQLTPKNNSLHGRSPDLFRDASRRSPG